MPRIVSSELLKIWRWILDTLKAFLCPDLCLPNCLRFKKLVRVSQLSVELASEFIGLRFATSTASTWPQRSMPFLRDGLKVYCPQYTSMNFNKRCKLASDLQPQICNVLCVELASKVQCPSTVQTGDLEGRAGLKRSMPFFTRWPWRLVLSSNLSEVCRWTNFKSQIFFQMRSTKGRRTETVANQYQCKNVIFVQPWHFLVCETWSKCETYFY